MLKSKSLLLAVTVLGTMLQLSSANADPGNRAVQPAVQSTPQDSFKRQDELEKSLDSMGHHSSNPSGSNPSGNVPNSGFSQPQISPPQGSASSNSPSDTKKSRTSESNTGQEKAQPIQSNLTSGSAGVGNHTTATAGSSDSTKK